MKAIACANCGTLLLRAFSIKVAFCADAEACEDRRRARLEARRLKRLKRRKAVAR